MADITARKGTGHAHSCTEHFFIRKKSTSDILDVNFFIKATVSLNIKKALNHFDCKEWC